MCDVTSMLSLSVSHMIEIALKTKTGASTFGFASDLIVGALNRERGSVVSQD